MHNCYAQLIHSLCTWEHVNNPLWTPQKEHPPRPVVTNSRLVGPSNANINQVRKIHHRKHVLFFCFLSFYFWTCFSLNKLFWASHRIDDDWNDTKPIPSRIVWRSTRNKSETKPAHWRRGRDWVGTVSAGVGPDRRRSAGRPAGGSAGRSARDDI